MEQHISNALHGVTSPRGRNDHPGAITTGFYDLDSVTGGIHPGDLILIASGGPADVGPILLNNFVLAASASEDVPVAFITFTKSPHQVSKGLLAVRSGHSRSSICEDKIDGHIIECAQHLATLPITIHGEVAAHVEGVVDAILAAHAHKLIVVDGLSIIAKRYRLPPKRLLERLQRHANLMKIPIIALAPKSWLEAWDVDVAFVVDEITSSPCVQVHIVVDRNGNTGWVNLKWDSLTETLSNIAPVWREAK